MANVQVMVRDLMTQGLTQREIAREVGLAQSTISRLNRGGRSRRKTIAKVAVIHRVLTPMSMFEAEPWPWPIGETYLAPKELAQVPTLNAEAHAASAAAQRAALNAHVGRFYPADHPEFYHVDQPTLDLLHHRAAMRAQPAVWAASRPVTLWDRCKRAFSRIFNS